MENSKDPKDMNVLQLYEHQRALENSQPLLTPESQEIVLAELEAIANTRSDKIDQLYYALTSHKDALLRIKEEEGMIKESKTHHQSAQKAIERGLRHIGRMLPAGQNKITGRNYQFVLSKRSTSAVRIDSQIENWTEEERNKFCIQKDTETITKTVIRSLTGEVLSQEETPNIKTEIIPNEDAIRNANQAQQRLPEGVYVYQTIAIKPKRIHGELEMDSSKYPRDFLSENSGAYKS